MPIENVSSTPQATSIRTGGTTTPDARKQTMDGEVFLRLLVTQLTHQDPSNPMNTNEMISQTTQLSMMEQLTALSDSSNEAFALNMRQAATAIIGKQVSYQSADNVTISGVVTKVSFEGPVPQVTVAGKTVALDAITEVSTTTAPAARDSAAA